MMGSAEMNTMDDLESFAEYSQSSLLYLLLEAMDIRNESAEYAASHAGVCKGIVTLLRGHEVHRTQVGCRGIAVVAPS
jgi:NADH dehydrogenase [ubiquinone] 1 alpha subcomplex assembly factor 6